MNGKILTIVAALAAANLTGCALTTDRIELAYTQQQGAATVPGASGIAVEVEVTDQRGDKLRVGSKKNGFGMEMAPILTVEDVAVTVRKAVEQELAARGFRLDAQAATVQIAADLTRFYNDYKPGLFAADAVADLNMSVAVRSRTGEQLYMRQIVAQGTETNVQLMTGDNARLALNRALQNGVAALFGDQAFVAALLASAASASKSAAN